MLVTLLAAMTANCARAQSSQDTTARDNDLKVSIITIYPGSEVYELYGHSIIRVTAQGVDAFFNYGVFDFNSQNFLLNFILGNTDYLCMAWPREAVFHDAGERKMVEQTLNLTPEEAKTVAHNLYVNSLPENRTYRYRYFSNNCATRPLEVVESAVGAKLEMAALSRWKGTTFRKVMAHYAAHYPWQQFGIDMLLGAPCDTLITQRQLLFSPMMLREALAGATVARDGQVRKFVEKETTLIEGSEQGTVLPPTPWHATPMALTSALLLMAAAVTLWTCRKARKAASGENKGKKHGNDTPRRDVTAAVFDTLLFAAMAVVGCLVWFVAFLSTHEAVSPNYNVLWLNPLLLALAIGAWKRVKPRFIVVCHALNVAATLTVGAVWLAGLQVPNAAFLPLCAASLMRSAAELICQRYAPAQTVKTHRNEPTRKK